MTLYTDLNKAPFPAFGGKSRIAAEVWSRFGNVRNYVEPFAFSAAVLLKRPGGPGAVETINDRNAFVTNFWRAVRSEPDAVAEHADWPVIEDDLHARHRWLVASDEAVARLDRVREDPEYFDAKIAGWWCWGACCWIGSGWCDETQQLPHMTGSQGLTQKLPHMTGSQGLTQKLPHMDAAGRLVLSPNDRRPGMSQAGLGVNAGGKIVPLWYSDRASRAPPTTPTAPSSPTSSPVAAASTVAWTSPPAASAASGSRAGCSRSPIGSAPSGSAAATGPASAIRHRR